MQRDHDSSAADEYGADECAATMEGGYLPYVERDECSEERRALVVEVADLRAELEQERIHGERWERALDTLRAERDDLLRQHERWLIDDPDLLAADFWKMKECAERAEAEAAALRAELAEVKAARDLWRQRAIGAEFRQQELDHG